MGSSPTGPTQIEVKSRTHVRVGSAVPASLTPILTLTQRQTLTGATIPGRAGPRFEAVLRLRVSERRLPKQPESPEH